MNPTRSLLLLLACAGCEGRTPDICETPRTYFGDGDHDGFGDDGDLQEACSAPVGFSETPGDCDDARADVFPGAPDDCCARDFNCDGVPGVDADGDGVASESSGGDDCDDANASVVRQESWYPDEDRDGYGLEDDDVRSTCGPPFEGYVSNFDDCDDTRADVHPGAEEICQDGVDGNCDRANEPCGIGGELATPPDEVELIWTGGTGHAVVAPIGDLDDDGTADLAIGVPSAGALAFATGSLDSGQVELDGWGALTPPAGQSFRALQGAGDLDEDGADDLLIVSDTDGSSGVPAAIWVLHGPLSGPVLIDDSLPHAIGPAQVNDRFGSSLDGRHDVTGDGEVDLIVADEQSGEVWVLSPPFDGASTATPAAHLSDATNEEMSICDLDGDGLVEVTGSGWTVSAPFSGDLSIPELADVSWTGGGRRGRCAGDLDGDSLEDVLFAGTTSDDGVAWTVAGKDLVAGGAVDPIGRIDPQEEEAAFFARDIAAPGDLDGDGFAEISLSATSGFYVGWGPLEGTVTAPSPSLWRFEQPYTSGSVVPSAGLDMNDDGVPDLLATAHGGPETGDTFDYVYVLSFTDGI